MKQAVDYTLRELIVAAAAPEIRDGDKIFIGGAEVCRFGNLNSPWIEENGKRTRLPGNGGAANIPLMAPRCITIVSTLPVSPS